MCHKSRIIFYESMIFLTIMPNTYNSISQEIKPSHVDQVMNKNKHINLKGNTINQQKYLYNSYCITKYNKSQLYKIDIYDVLVQRCNIEGTSLKCRLYYARITTFHMLSFILSLWFLFLCLFEKMLALIPIGTQILEKLISVCMTTQFLKHLNTFAR